MLLPGTTDLGRAINEFIEINAAKVVSIKIWYERGEKVLYIVHGRG